MNFFHLTPSILRFLYGAVCISQSGVNFPLSVSVSLQQGGSPVAGAAAQHTFHTSSDSANLSFTAPLAAASAPATLQVVGNGTAYLYGIMGITISRLGDIPTT